MTQPWPPIAPFGWEFVVEWMTHRIEDRTSPQVRAADSYDHHRIRQGRHSCSASLDARERALRTLGTVLAQQFARKLYEIRIERLLKIVHSVRPPSLLGLLSGSDVSTAEPFNLGRLANVLGPRVWYIVPQAELSARISAARGQ